MADYLISGLPAALGLSGTDLMEVEQGADPTNTSGKATLAQLQAFITSGLAIGTAGYQFAAETGSIIDAAPGAGKITWNNASQAAATIIYIDDTTADAIGLTGVWASLVAGGFMFLQAPGDQAKWSAHKITTVVDATGYVKLTVTLLAKGADFADGDALRISIDNGTTVPVVPTWYKNLIINGQFNINQRQKSGSVVLAAGAYGHDRWKAGASGCTYTFASSAGVTTITISAGSLQQVIEGINIRTDTHVLSWTGTAQGKIAGGSYGASGVTGSLTGGSDATVEFNTGTLTSVQVTPGTVAQAFINIGDIEELKLCQRYCFRFNLSGVDSFVSDAEMTNSGVLAFVTGRFPVKMRVDPTFVLEGVASDYKAYSYASYGYQVCSSVYANSVTNTEFYLFAFECASVTPNSHMCFVTNGQNTKSVRFEAEL